MPDAKGPSDKRRGKNGAALAPMPALALADGVAYDDPMSKVLGLDAQATSATAWLGYTLGAFALLLGMMVTARVVTVILESMNAQAAPPPVAPQEIDVMRDEPPPPPPPPAPTEAPEAKPEPPPVPKAAPKEAPPPAPAPAQAAKVLTQEPDPNEPVDLTGNTIVQGNADAYAGGTTMANGTSTRAVRGIASPTGVPGGTGAPQAKAAGGPDRSRKCSVGGTEWNCPFPPEADTAQVDDAYVTLHVDLRPDGSPQAVRIVNDPGNGFGREAKRCAMSKSYTSGLDRDGNAIPCDFTTRVHFSR
jgi:protein TonB